MEEKKEKRVLRIELDDDVKKVSITGKNGDEQVVMSQELDEDDLDKVAGGSPMSSLYGVGSWQAKRAELSSVAVYFYCNNLTTSSMPISAPWAICSTDNPIL